MFIILTDIFIIFIFFANGYPNQSAQIKTSLSVPFAAPSGCTHFIIGRDMAGCKSSITGNDFYGAYDAQELATKHSVELSVQVC